MLHALRCFLSSPTVIGWATFFADVFVALVIYVELEHNRLSAFIERATKEGAAGHRSEIYNAYLAITEFSTLEETQRLEKRSEEFMRLLLTGARPTRPDDAHATAAEKHTDHAVTLKEMCDGQISLFNELGRAIGRWYSPKKPFVEVFPHAAIYLWIILRPYIVQRQDDTGEWLATPLISFTLKSVTYVLDKNPERGLHLRHADGKEGIHISRTYLADVEKNLARVLNRPLPSRD